MALDLQYPIVNLTTKSSKSRRLPSPPKPITPQLHPQPEFSENVKKVHSDYLSKYFSPDYVAALDSQLQQKAFHDIQTKPLYLTVFDPYGLGRLTYTQYSHALKEARPNVHSFSKNIVLRLVQLIDMANHYYASGYRLCITDQNEENPGLRMALFHAMGELQIMFTPTSLRLRWPMMDYVRQDLMNCLNAVLPRVQPKLLPLPPGADFERMLHTSGSWIVEFDFSLSQASPRYPELVKLLDEDGFAYVNMKCPPSTGSIITGIELNQRLCFIGCNPLSLIFWFTVFNDLHSKQISLKNVVFCFDTCYEEFEFLDVLKKLQLPIFRFDTSSLPVHYAPDYLLEDGLASPVFSHPLHYTPSVLYKISGALLHETTNPLCWVPDTDYEEVLSWVSDRRFECPFVGIITNTQHEANGIWSDFYSAFRSGLPFFPGMKCTLSNDPARPPLFLQERAQDATTWSVTELGTHDLIGDDFKETELEQIEVTPFHRATFRLYRRIVYYSNSVITKQRLLTITRYALNQVVILASKENMRELLS
jgi:hypothetical protein